LIVSSCRSEINNKDKGKEGAMVVQTKKIKIFKIRNRSGYAAVCFDHLTEGKTILEAYSRMLKALRRSRIKIKDNVSNVKSLVTFLG
jgi:hypothetical protein